MAAALGLPDGVDYSADLRGGLFNYMEENKKVLRNRYGNAKAWGESEEIEMLADMLQRVIAVYDSQGDGVQYFELRMQQSPAKTEYPTLYLWHEHNWHYDAMIPQ